jgi:5-methylcytosine-specific restriction endonuclease McrA
LVKPLPTHEHNITHAALLEFAKKYSGKYFQTVARRHTFMVEVIDDEIVCYPESGVDVWLTPSIQLKQFNTTNELHPGKYPAETWSNSYFVALISAILNGTKPIPQSRVPRRRSSSQPPSPTFDSEVRQLRKDVSLFPPEGQEHPTKKEVVTIQVCRDPAVKAWVLKTSKGKCAYCRKKAPFIDDDSLPFLEVHHVLHLANGGPDTVNNAVALCPNCHRALHHAKDRETRVAELYQSYGRLKKRG